MAEFHHSKFCQLLSYYIFPYKMGMIVWQVSLKGDSAGRRPVSSFYIFELCKWFILSKSFKFGPSDILSGLSMVYLQWQCNPLGQLLHTKHIFSWLSQSRLLLKRVRKEGICQWSSLSLFIWKHVWIEALFQNLVSGNLLVVLVKINNSRNSSPRFQSKTCHRMRLIRQFDKDFTITMTIGVGHFT